MAQATPSAAGTAGFAHDTIPEFPFVARDMTSSLPLTAPPGPGFAILKGERVLSNVRLMDPITISAGPSPGSAEIPSDNPTVAAIAGPEPLLPFVVRTDRPPISSSISTPPATPHGGSERAHGNGNGMPGRNRYVLAQTNSGKCR